MVKNYDDDEVSLDCCRKAHALNATYALAHVWDSTIYGASADATWQVNRDAINAAIAACRAAGGGVVLLPPGEVTVKGIVQESWVDLRFQGTTLVHPDGLNGHIINSSRRTVVGATAAGTNVLTVDDASGVDVGAVVAIRGAGGMAVAQNMRLTGAITADQTTGVALDSTTGMTVSTNITTWLIVGSEIIEYTGVSGGVLQGVIRGALGTTPADHAAGALIGQSVRHYARVVAKSGTTLVLDRMAATTVADTEVHVGIAEPRLSGGARFYGNRPPGGAASNPYPVNWDTVGGGTFDSITADQCEAALFLGSGTADVVGYAVIAHECGNAPVKGSSVWLFRGVTGCQIGHLHRRLH